MFFEISHKKVLYFYWQIIVRDQRLSCFNFSESLDVSFFVTTSYGSVSDSSPEPTEAAATERVVGLISTGWNPS